MSRWQVQCWEYKITMEVNINHLNFYAILRSDPVLGLNTVYSHMHNTDNNHRSSCKQECHRIIGISSAITHARKHPFTYKTNRRKKAKDYKDTTCDRGCRIRRHQWCLWCSPRVTLCNIVGGSHRKSGDWRTHRWC